jgi:hypothetical protein
MCSVAASNASISLLIAASQSRVGSSGPAPESPSSAMRLPGVGPKSVIDRHRSETDAATGSPSLARSPVGAARRLSASRRRLARSRPMLVSPRNS